MGAGHVSLAFALLFLHTTLGFRQAPQEQILSILYLQSYYSNPLLGVGVPPPEAQAVPKLGGVPNITADVQLILEEAHVNDTSNSFDATYSWHLRYNDSRFFRNYWEDTTPKANCTTFCSTLPNTVKNKYGEEACCMQNYNMNAHFLNLKGSQLTRYPQEWYWYGSPDSDEVNYFFRSRSTFNANLDFSGFPFDQQLLQFLIFGDFVPRLTPNSFVLNSFGPKPLPLPYATAAWSNAPSNGIKIEGWDVLSVSSTSVVYNFGRYGSVAEAGGSVQRETVRPGLAFTVKVARRTKALYVQLFIIPPALEVLLVFIGYYLTLDSLRNRMEYLGVLFLSLLFVQYTVRYFLPAAVLMPPYIVCLICYGYVFAFAASFVVIEYVGLAHLRSSRKKRHLTGRLKYAHFKRDQLKLLGRLSNGRPHQVSAGLLEVDKSGNERLLATVQAEIDRLEADEKALEGPWYLRHRSPVMQALLQRFRAVRRVDKWWYCLSQPSSEKYCFELAEQLERMTGCILFVCFYVAVTLVYVMHNKLYNRVGPI